MKKFTALLSAHLWKAMTFLERLLFPSVLLAVILKIRLWNG